MTGANPGEAVVSAPARVLVVDDAPEVRLLVESVLTKDGLTCSTLASGEEAVARCQVDPPDVVILDLVLPGQDGLETCRQIRAICGAYVLMLTARDEEFDKVLGLTVGADDYLTKPFSPRELVARVRALLRRGRAGVAAEAGSSGGAGADAEGSAIAAGTSVPVAEQASRQRILGALVVDPDTREVWVAGTPIALTRIEFDILDALTARPRVVVERGALLRRIWGDGWFGDDHVVDVHVSNLRRKLAAGGAGEPFVATVRGVGYRVVAAAPAGR